MNAFEQGLQKYLTQKQLKLIQSSTIGIGGSGGLGSNVAMILVRTGFVNIEILDCDDIEPSNLNRQQYFIDEIEKNKVETLKKRLLKINPGINCITHNIEWSLDNASDFFKNREIIIESFDKPDDKTKFIEYYQDKTKYIVSGNGMAGIAGGTATSIKKLKNIYIIGDQSTDTGDGHPPLAPRVTACAATMADVVLNLTLSP